MNIGSAAALLAAGLAGACTPVARDVSPPVASAVNIDPRRIALAPLDYVRFCMDNARDCRMGAPNAVIGWTPEIEAAIERTNLDVNRRIQPTRLSSNWRIDPALGNCNDYVVTKRHHLIAMGLPPSALLIAVAQTAAGEGHLLLILRTDRGDLVLDNLVSDIRSRSATDYAWLKRQSAVDPVLWEQM